MAKRMSKKAEAQLIEASGGVLRAFGRHYLPDKRDREFLFQAEKTPRVRRYWDDTLWWGDQGKTPMCVGYAWAHWLTCRPAVYYLDPAGIYDFAQRIDEREGTDYDGTSVRAGAKALRRLGLITSYHWATNLDDLINGILTVGPVVVGTNWYEYMTKVDKRGFIHPRGRLLGGHAYLISGVNVPAKKFRIKNSWGRGWGAIKRRYPGPGRAVISFDDMELLLKRRGEACIAIQKKAMLKRAAI